MAKFRCEQCGFRFSRESSDTPRRCPYCSKENAVVSEVSEHDLLKDLDEMMK